MCTYKNGKKQRIEITVSCAQCTQSTHFFQHKCIREIFARRYVLQPVKFGAVRHPLYQWCAMKSSIAPYNLYALVGLLSKGTLFSFTWQFCVCALDCSSEIAAWSFFMLYRSKINIQGVHCAPGTNIWFVCTGTWKDNKIKKEITFKRLFCGFVSSKPEGRKTVIGTYVQNVIEYWMQNQHSFSRKKSNF